MAEGERKAKVSPMKTLYELSISEVAIQYCNYKKYLMYLPPNVLFDLCYELYAEKKICRLEMELANLKMFIKFLMATNRGVRLLNCFQASMDHGSRVAKELAVSNNVYSVQIVDNLVDPDKAINSSLRLGGFLNDAGWYLESEQVLLPCRALLSSYYKTPENLCKTLDCCFKLLHAQSSYCLFSHAKKTYNLARKIVSKLEHMGYEKVNYAALFAEFSALFFIRSEYKEAYRWAMEALKQLKPTLQARVIIDVLRQASKSCAIRRELQKAGLLIRQAIYLAAQVFDTNHPKYSDVLIDYGYYLLNSDNIVNSVSAYKTALDIRKAIFGKTNLHVALAHEDLAYALYVHEYSSGEFPDSNVHVEKAIDIMEKLLPSDHLMLASAKRVKALIFEEIAIGNPPTLLTAHLLLQSERLHLSALQLVKNAFGEKNVQTAKMYGNLGRLYQSMKQYEQAEEMHLKAISIKEELLGPEDHEIGLSMGHLASLYNYHMNLYKDAEKLYQRSIAISLKLFGESFSGLEYDYRGLLRVYTELNEHEKAQECADMLNHWMELRDENEEVGYPLIDLQKSPDPIEDVLHQFFSM